MREIINALRMIPAAGRYLGGLFLTLIIILVLARRFRIPSSYTWIVVAVVVIAFALFYLVGFLRKRKEKKDAREFESNLGLQSRQATVGKEEIRDALGELSQKWEEAVRQLRAADMSIYDLPWYLLIGEPQSGKSTTIQNSGLEFPVGTESLSGSGGTRNCDWWFTNEAVILDTAGRFTFQESNAPDQHEWNVFLKLLSKHRKRCPINGVVVVIPVTSLVEDPVDVIESKAKNIRQKLQHLQKALGILFPVFVLITKADRILGFTEFFSRLDPIDQRQLFGWSSQSTQAIHWDPKAFDKNFDEIFSRVHKMRMKFFHGEENTSKIDKLFVFPEELNALREPLALYLNTVFSGSRFEEPLMLRGFFFTSGVQQGRPFALACKELLRVRTGDPEGILENLEQVFTKSRAFFIRDFYEKKVFPEQGLVAKTREALRQETVRRRILIGGAAAVSLVLLPLVLWAVTSLRTTVGATTENVRRAEKCLNGDDPCSAKQAYDLIQALEKNKTDLERKWMARWMFLKGRNNPVVVRYIPAAQAALLSEKIIGPLQSTFDHRASTLDWTKNLDLYLTFREAFIQLLRFQEVSDPNADSERKRELRTGMTLEALFTFCEKTKGGDPSENGELIDDWLYTDTNAARAADRLFISVLEEFPKIADENPPPSIRGAREAMLRFWTVASLAGWDFRLLQVHFEEGFLGFFREVEKLNAPHTPDRAATLRDFFELAEVFDNSWLGAEDLMRTGRPSAGSAEESPGVSPEQWRAFCIEDFARVRDVSEDVFVLGDITSRCEAIPREYRELERNWLLYDFLVDGSPDATEAGDRLVWSEPAVTVYNAVMDLRKDFDPTEIESATRELESLLGQGLGVKNQLDEINTAQQRETSKHIVPIEKIATYEESQFDEAVRILMPVAELGVAARLLPPVREFFEKVVFDPGNEALFTAERARENVPKANDFLVWAQRTLRDVSNQPTTSDEIRAIDDAIYGYVRDLVEREISSMGGGGGGAYFVMPRNAERADSWRGFVDAVSQWQHVGRSRTTSRAGSSTGVDSTMLADFAQQNTRLEGLSRQLRDAQRARAPTGESGPVVPATLERAISDFKSTVARLDADALEAWRQLAEDPEALDSFHSFSRLGRGRYVSDLQNGLEEHGARLLTSEIEPAFERAFDDFWRGIDDYAVGYFPFITRSQLEQARDMYARGYYLSDRQEDDRDSRGRRSRRSSGDALWSERTSDTAQRLETIVLNLPTASHRDAEDVFKSLDGVMREFRPEPILDGTERMIDFVGSAKAALSSLRAWGLYLGSDGGSRRRSQEEVFEARLLPQHRHRDGTFLLERVNSIYFFDAQRPIRSSTEQWVEVPFVMNEQVLTVVGEDEDRASGWKGRLVIEGGDFKLPFFVLVAADAPPSDDRKVWEVRVEIPAYNRGVARLDGIFELSFDRGIPDVLPDSVGAEDD